MNFKKLNIKISALVLSLTTLAGTSPIHAINLDFLSAPGESLDATCAEKIHELEHSEETNEHLRRIIAQFETLGKGHFKVSQEAIDNVNPLALFIYLKKTIIFFEKYENIKNALIDMAIRNGVPFTIDSTYEPESPVIMRHLGVSNRICINTRFCGKQLSLLEVLAVVFENIMAFPNPGITETIENYVGFIMLHELGHIVDEIYLYHNFPGLIPETQKMDTFRQTCPPELSIFTHLDFLLNLDEKVRGYILFREKIIEKRNREMIIQDVYNERKYTGQISGYANTQATEWLPEGIAFAMCNTPERLAKISDGQMLNRILEWLKDFDESLGSKTDK